MDYEKKYNEALAWMRSVYPTLQGATKEDAEHYFPELAESEDERIRKWLIDYFGSIKETVWIHRDITCEQILAWLEKQKESLHVPESCKENPDSFTDEHPNIIYTEMGEEFAKQKEQKGLDVTDFCQPIHPDIAKVLPDVINELTWGDDGQQEQKPVETSDFKTKLAEYLQNNSPKDGKYVISSESILQMAKEELIKRGIVVEREQCCMGINGDPDPATGISTLKAEGK